MGNLRIKHGGDAYRVAGLIALAGMAVALAACGGRGGGGSSSAGVKQDKGGVGPNKVIASIGSAPKTGIDGAGLDGALPALNFPPDVAPLSVSAWSSNTDDFPFYRKEPQQSTRADLSMVMSVPVNGQIPDVGSEPIYYSAEGMPTSNVVLSATSKIVDNQASLDVDVDADPFDLTTCGLFNHDRIVLDSSDLPLNQGEMVAGNIDTASGFGGVSSGGPDPIIQFSSLSVTPLAGAPFEPEPTGSELTSDSADPVAYLPEPATGALALLGLLALYVGKGRKQG